MGAPPNTRPITVYIDDAVYREIRVYAAQTDRTITQVIEPLKKQFEDSALEMVSRIRELPGQIITKQENT